MSTVTWVIAASCARRLAREFAHRHQQIDPRARGGAAGVRVEIRSLGAQLEHVPQDRDASRGPCDVCERAESRIHGDGVRVVGVVEEGDAD